MGLGLRIAGAIGRASWERSFWRWRATFRQHSVEVDDEVLKWGGVAASITSEIAVFYSVVGDVPAALRWLDRAVRHGDERGDYFARDPLFANVKDDARFAQILDSLRYRSRQRTAAR